MGDFYARLVAMAEFKNVTIWQVANEADIEIEKLKQSVKNLEDRVTKLEPVTNDYGGYFG